VKTSLHEVASVTAGEIGAVDLSHHFIVGKTHIFEIEVIEVVGAFGQDFMGWVFHQKVAEISEEDIADII
jgi:hypothetical protein